MASEPHHPPTGPLPRSAAGSAALPIRLHGVRVLLVDDDTEQLALLLDLLSEAGADVHGVTSAHQAVRALAQHAFDVIVSDIHLPDCDGYHLLRMIRARPAAQGGRTPAIALTGRTTEGDRTRAHLAGYQIHLAKPIRLIELVVAIRDVVDERADPPPGGA
jgi:CheY-like chemotaxis protein